MFVVENRCSEGRGINYSLVSVTLAYCGTCSRSISSERESEDSFLRQHPLGQANRKHFAILKAGANPNRGQKYYWVDQEAQTVA
jgi:hypothetical protein